MYMNFCIQGNLDFTRECVKLTDDYEGLAVLFLQQLTKISLSLHESLGITTMLAYLWDVFQSQGWTKVFTGLPFHH